MGKWIVGFLMVFICLSAQNVYANSKYLRMYTEEPEEKYEVIGQISYEEPLLEYESFTVLSIGRGLQTKALKLGADALITGKVERFLKVTTKKEDYDIDPFLEAYYLSPYIRIHAIAIKMDKAN